MWKPECIKKITTIFIGIVLVHAGLAGCTGFPSTSPPPPTQESQIEVVSVDAYWSQAMALAKDWRPDAYIRTVTIGVPLPESNFETTPAMFDIEAPSETMATFGVACDEQGCDSFEILQKEDVPVDHCKPLQLDDFQISSQEALQIGLRNGGEAFIDNELAFAKLDLSYGVANCRDRLTWYFSIFEPVTYGTGVRIDAQTGEVFEPPPGW